MLPLGLFLWPALDLVVVYLAMLPQSRWRRLVRPWVAHRAVCIAFCVPLALALVPEIQARAGNYWVKVPGWQRIWQALGNSLLFQFDGDPDTFVGGWVNWFLVALLLLAAVAGVLKLRKRADALAIVIASAFVPIAVIVLISLHTPIWVSRYFQISTPAFSLLLASGLAAAWAHGKGRVIVFLIAGLAILQLADLQGGTRRADWRPLLAAVEHAPENVVLVVASLHSFQEMDYEWRRQGAKRTLEFAGISRNGEPTRLSWKHVDIHALGKTHSDVTYWLINPSGKMRSSVETNFWPDRTPCWFGDRRVRALIYRPPHGNLGVRERQVGNCKT
ncbi:MAG: hypothetical protein KDJ47_07580 [Hyphomicrobiaceae bacterium]|nr:hypothetical protein [Hyphomicrobiaceae bacterium]